MIRALQLIRTEAVLVRRVEHVPGVLHRDPNRECVGSHGINFVEAGSFRVRTTGRWHRLDERCMFVTAPTMEFSCAHDDDYPVDRCYSIRYADEAVESARAFVTLGAPPVLLLTNRQAFLHRMLRQCAKGDEARTEALSGALLGSLATHVPRQPLFRPDRLAWYGARIDRAKALIEARHCGAAFALRHGPRRRDERLPLRAHLQGARRRSAASIPHRGSPCASLRTASRGGRGDGDVLCRRFRFPQPLRHELPAASWMPPVGSRRQHGKPKEKVT